MNDGGSAFPKCHKVMVKPIALNQQVRFWRLSLLIGIVAAATDVVPSRVCAQIYVTDSQAGTISKYATSGMLTTGTLVTGLTRPTALAVSGSHLFVVGRASRRAG